MLLSSGVVAAGGILALVPFQHEPTASATPRTVGATVTSTFAPEADARVHESSPTTNYGTSKSLRVDGAADPDVESFLRFTVAGLAGTVTRATLRLHATSGTSDGPTVARTSDDWVETTITWNTRPGPTTPVAADAGPIAAGGWMELDVSALVEGEGAISFVLAPTSSNGVDFDSRQSTTESFRPQLVVETLTSGAPVASFPPAITGDPREGQTLSGSTGTWNGTQPMTFATQWQRCDESGFGCVDLEGQVGDTYTATSSDVGARVRVTVTATNDDGSGVASSAPTPTILAAGDVVVAAAGDIASCTSTADEATALVLDGIAPDYVLTLGDQAYPDGTAAEYAECYEPSWGRHKPRTLPTPGNHDYHTAGAAGYFGYFGGVAGDPAKGYYAVDLGPWRFYSLNSNCASVPCGAGSEQEQWLRADLASTSPGCLAAFMHHPRFSSSASGGTSSVDALWRALHDYGADLVLAGHIHSYERFARLTPAGAIDRDRGVRLIVVGTGGASLYPFGAPVTGSEARGTAFGVLRLVLGDEGYRWEFVPVAGATFADSGSETCGSTPADTSPPSAPSQLTLSSAIAGSVTFGWMPAVDDVGVVRYDVYRDGSLLAQTTLTTHVDQSAVEGATHAYHVVAVDAADNQSPPSNTVTVTVEPLPSGNRTFAPDADARVLESKPRSNYGKAVQLRTDGGTDPDVESYLRFTVTGVEGSVQRAVLRVYAYTTTADGPAVFGTESAWTETAITWATKPPATTGALDDEAAVRVAGWVEYDVTSFVTGNGSFSFGLATTTTDGVDFHSRDASQLTLRPQLVVTFG